MSAKTVRNIVFALLIVALAIACAGCSSGTGSATGSSTDTCGEAFALVSCILTKLGALDASANGLDTQTYGH